MAHKIIYCFSQSNNISKRLRIAIIFKSKLLSDESINPPAARNNSLAPALNYINTKSWVKFNGSCLKQEKVTFTYKKVVNIYIVYEINVWSYTQGVSFSFWNPLFGAAKLIKNGDLDKHWYSEYIGLMLVEVSCYLIVVGLVKM